METLRAFARRIRRRVAGSTPAAGKPSAASWQEKEAQALALRAEQPRAAAELIREILVDRPDSIRLLRAGGRLLMKTGDHESAKDYWERLAGLAPDAPEPHLQLARIHWRAQRCLESVVCADRLLALQPAHQEARRLRDQARAKALATSWLEAAGRAAAFANAASAARGVNEALNSAPRDADIFSDAVALLQKCVRLHDAVSLWKACRHDGSVNLSLGLGLLRALDAVGQADRILETFAQILSDAPPFAALAARDLRRVIEMVRLLVQRSSAQGPSSVLEHLGSTVAARNAPGGFVSWILGSIALARADRSAALAHFDEGLGHPRLPAELALDLHAEKAVLFASYHLFAEALDASRQMPPELLQTDRYYQRRLEIVSKVSAACDTSPGPITYPESLVDVIVEECSRAPVAYAARPREMAMVSRCLGQGGGERQSITLLRRMIRDTRLAKISLFVRSTHMRQGDDFFLPVVREMGLDLTVYGRSWHDRSDVAQALPELRGRPRLQQAIDLLPITLREDVVRLCRLLFDHRPEIVHVWQDLPGAVLACFIVGVPRFLIRRGSLSPDHWGYSERQVETQIRPMRHVIRCLLERSGLLVLNNSTECSRTDQVWTSWPDPSRFMVIRNAVDFGKLGANGGRNAALRRSLGIPQDAPVIGGAFRMVAVKRPEVWFETARLVGAACPQAHFVIIGDGPLSAAIADLAARNGLSGRFHLPGRVSEVGDWYRIMNVMLLTSSREGTPNVIIEAQHFGVPSVATDVGGISEIVAVGESALLVPGDSAQDYAEKVLWILDNPDWAEAAARHGQDYVHRMFDIGGIVDQFMDVYGMADRPATARQPEVSTVPEPADFNSKAA